MILNGAICLNIGLVNSMKKSFFVVLIISLAFVFLSCASKSHLETSEESSFADSTASDSSDNSFRHEKLANHSFLTEKNIGESFAIYGLIVKNGEDFVLIENPKSKSRVSFILTFEEDYLKEKVALKANVTAEISGILVSVESPWRKGLKVVDIK